MANGVHEKQGGGAGFEGEEVSEIELDFHIGENGFGARELLLCPEHG